ncbi:MFS general substrate transporter [Canariomyces notabilis]|uniref:MFS general substrate transporter n=1 Tax=Canariomyces notabilis TaxID=2074819 RepID=A0AAN6TKE5_9PEZI|nr:MFS general substrate transporter [Canariomyces arenarius]
MSEPVVTTTAPKTAHGSKATLDEVRAREQPTFSQKKEALPRQTEVANADHLSPATREVAEPAETWDEKSEYLTGFKLAMVIACMCLACCLMLIDTMVVSTAIPRITDEFHSLADVGWYATAYQFGSAAPQPLSGKVFAHFSNKYSFLLFFLIFEIGSVLCGAAVSSAMLIVGRAIAGIGAAGIINGALIIISSSVPMEKRPGLIGIVMGFNQLGLVIGPLIGGAFTSYSTWRWCFYLNLPIGALVVAGLLLVHVPEQAKKPPSITILRKLHRYLDLVGSSLFAPAVLQLILALQFGSTTFPWNSSQVIGLFCGAAATFVVWLIWNRYRGADALLPAAMITRTAVWTSGLYQAFLMAAVYGAIFFLPIYFQAINGASPMMSGVYLLPTILPQLAMAASSGALIIAVGYVIPLAALSTVLLSIASGLYSILRPNSPTCWWVGFQILGGAGSGLGLQVAIIAIQTVVTGEELSSAMAFVVFAQSLGPAIVLTLCQLIFYTTLRAELPIQAPNANSEAIIGAGATGYRAIVSSEDLPGVIVAYANSIDRVFYLVAGMAAACGLVLWGMGWKDLRKKDPAEAKQKA